MPPDAIPPEEASGDVHPAWDQAGGLPDLPGAAAHGSDAQSPYAAWEAVAETPGLATQAGPLPWEEAGAAASAPTPPSTATPWAQEAQATPPPAPATPATSGNGSTPSGMATGALDVRGVPGPEAVVQDPMGSSTQPEPPAEAPPPRRRGSATRKTADGSGARAKPVKQRRRSRKRETAQAEPEQAKRPREKRKLYSYKYVLRTVHGVTLRGSIRAFSEEQARKLVSQPGSELVKLKKTSEFLSLSVGGGKVKTKELVVFTRQLSAFIRAGVPLVDSLSSIGGEHATRKLQDTLRLVSADLSEGVSLSDAMARHPKVFPAFYVDLVRAGELTGRLDVVLDKAAHYLDRTDEAQRQMRSALAYPGIILGVALLTIVVMVTFVLPRFVTFFESFDAELPLPTRILMNTANFIGEWWWAILAVLLIVILGAALWFRTPSGRVVRDRMLLGLPGLGGVVRYSIVERFCSTLSTMVSAGVPLAKTFQIVTQGTNNALFEKGLHKVQEQMMVGQGMSGPIAATGLFPAIVPQMIRVGEDTGTLDHQLEIAAGFFGDELEFRLKRFTAIFEPLVIVVVAVIVGFVALALVSAMYGIYEQVQ